MTNNTENKKEAKREPVKRGPNRSFEEVYEEKVADLERKIAYHADLEKGLKVQLKAVQSEKATREKAEKDSAAEKIAAMKLEILRLESL